MTTKRNEIPICPTLFPSILLCIKICGFCGAKMDILRGDAHVFEALRPIPGIGFKRFESDVVKIGRRWNRKKRVQIVADRWFLRVPVFQRKCSFLGRMSDLWGKFQIILAQCVVVSNCFGPFFGHFRVRSEISGMSPGDACHLFVNGDGCKVVRMCTWPIPRFRSRALRTLHYVFRAFCDTPICLLNILFGKGNIHTGPLKCEFCLAPSLLFSHFSHWYRSLSSLILFCWVDCGLSFAVWSRT